MKITEKNIFEKGILLQLTIGDYNSHQKMSKEQLKELPTEIVRGSYQLFDKDFKGTLDKIWNYGNQTRMEMGKLSVPFFIHGFDFIPTTNVAKAIEIMEDRKIVRDSMVDSAAEDYEDAKAIFEERYPDYYNAAKDRYPSKNEFKNKFYMKYRLFQINTPNAESGMVSPEAYKQEMRKFKESIDEMKADVVSAIYTELVEKTKAIQSQCEKGKPNQRTLDNLNQFFQRMDDVYADFIDRKDIKDVANKIRAQLLGLDAKSLKDSSLAKDEFKRELAKATEQLKALPDIKLKRALDF